jgi:hypothetical protein
MTTPISATIPTSIDVRLQGRGDAALSLAQKAVDSVVALRVLSITSGNQLLTMLDNSPLALKWPQGDIPADVRASITNGQPLLMKILSLGASPQLAFVGVGQTAQQAMAAATTGLGINVALTSIQTKDGASLTSQANMSPPDIKATVNIAQIPSSALAKAVGQATLQAAARQEGLAPLLANLQQILTNPLSSDQDYIGRMLQSTLLALNNQTLDAEQPIAAEKIRALIQHSGLFHENRGLNTPDFLNTRDLKGLLLDVRQLLAHIRPHHNAEISPPLLEHDTPPPPPLKGGSLPHEALTKAAIPADMPLIPMIDRLIGQASGTIERITLMQLASLPDHVTQNPSSHETARPHAPNQEQTPRNYVFELPIRTNEGTASLGLKVKGPLKDQNSSNSYETTRDIWQVEFGLDLEPLGPIQAHVHIRTVQNGLAHVSVNVWAERTEVARTFQNKRADLWQALSNAQFEVDELHIQSGKPAAVTAHTSPHVVDIQL